MTFLQKLILTATVGPLLGVPGATLAVEQCILKNEAQLPGYASLMAEGLVKSQAKQQYVNADEDSPENAFISGAVGLHINDLFMSIQFSREGKLTDFDVHRRNNEPVDEVLVHLVDECLVPYEADLAPLSSYIDNQVAREIEAEEERKAKLEE
jgi:hypothetical protein